MKKTFSNRILDWILIGTSLFFSILTSWNLSKEFDFFSAYLLKTAFALVSIMAFLTLVIPKINAERFSRIFILVVLIIPAVLTANLFITDLVIYGVTRTDLLQNPSIYLKLIGGIILFYMTLKYSRQQKKEQKKDYGILILGIGIFSICYVLTRSIEPNFNSDSNVYPIWKIIVKSIIGITTVLIGIRIKNQKVKFIKGLIWTIVLMLIFGLI